MSHRRPFPVAPVTPGPAVCQSSRTPSLVTRADRERRRSDIQPAKIGVSLQTVPVAQNASLHESPPVSAALRCQKGGETALSFQGCRRPPVIGQRRLEDAANRWLPSRPPWLRLCDWPRCCRARNGRRYRALLASGSTAASAHSSSDTVKGEFPDHKCAQMRHGRRQISKARAHNHPLSSGPRTQHNVCRPAFQFQFLIQRVERADSVYVCALQECALVRARCGVGIKLC